jgi:hypothetical protein
LGGDDGAAGAGNIWLAGRDGGDGRGEDGRGGHGRFLSTILATVGRRRCLHGRILRSSIASDVELLVPLEFVEEPPGELADGRDSQSVGRTGDQSAGKEYDGSHWAVLSVKTVVKETRLIVGDEKKLCYEQVKVQKVGSSWRRKKVSLCRRRIISKSNYMKSDGQISRKGEIGCVRRTSKKISLVLFPRKTVKKIEKDLEKTPGKRTGQGKKKRINSYWLEKMNMRNEKRNRVTKHAALMLYKKGTPRTKVI